MRLVQVAWLFDVGWLKLVEAQLTNLNLPQPTSTSSTNLNLINEPQSHQSTSTSSINLNQQTSTRPPPCNLNSYQPVAINICSPPHQDPPSGSFSALHPDNVPPRTRTESIPDWQPGPYPPELPPKEQYCMCFPVFFAHTTKFLVFFHILLKQHESLG